MPSQPVSVGLEAGVNAAALTHAALREGVSAPHGGRRNANVQHAGEAGLPVVCSVAGSVSPVPEDMRASAQVCAAAALGAATALAALAAPPVRRVVDDDARSSSRGSSACMARLVMKEALHAHQSKHYGGDEAEEHGVVKARLLPAAELSLPSTKICRLCNQPAPCTAPCPAALAAVALHGLQLQHTYSTGRFKVACFGSATPSNTPSGSGCSTPPQSPRPSLAAVSSVNSEVLPGVIARYPAILGAAEALASALPITPGLLQRGPGSVASGASSPRPPCSSPAPSCGSRVSSGGREVVVQVQHHFYHHHQHTHDHHHHHHHHHGQHPMTAAPQATLVGVQHLPASACAPVTRTTTPGPRCMSRASSSASDASMRCGRYVGSSASEGSAAHPTPLPLEEAVGLDTSRVQRRGRFVVMDVEVPPAPPPPCPGRTTTSDGSEAKGTLAAELSGLQSEEGGVLVRQTQHVLDGAPCEIPAFDRSCSPDAPWLDSTALAEIAGAAVVGPAERTAEQAAASHVASALERYNAAARHSLENLADPLPGLATPGEEQPHEQCRQVRVGRSISDAAVHNSTSLLGGQDGLSSAFSSAITPSAPVAVGSLSSPGRPVGSRRSSLEGRSSLPLPAPTPSTAGKLSRTSSAGGGDLGRSLSRQSSAGAMPSTLPPATPSRVSSAGAVTGGAGFTPQPTPRAYRKGRFNIQELPTTQEAAADTGLTARSSQSAFTAHAAQAGWGVDGTGLEDATLLTAISAGVADSAALDASVSAPPGELRSLPVLLQPGGRQYRRSATVGSVELRDVQDSPPDLAAAAGQPPRAATSALAGKAGVRRGLAFSAPRAVGEIRDPGSPGRTSGDDEGRGAPASFACWVPPAEDDEESSEPRWVRSPGSSECSLDGYRAPPVSMTDLLELRLEARLEAQRPPPLSVPREMECTAGGGMPTAPLSTRRVGRFTILEEGE